MKQIERITSAIEKNILSRVRNNTFFAEYYQRTSDKKIPWKQQATVYQAKEVEDWQKAIMAATDPDDPRRGLLMRFYQSMKLDNHLQSCIDTRILRVQRSSYKIVNDKGEENDQLKTLLERPWFEEAIRLTLMSRFQGSTLMEMFDTTDQGELYRVREIPQSNFIAQKGIILKEEYDQKGTSYIEGTYKDYYLQIGGDWDVGMFNELAMIVIAKKLGLGSWMGYIDKMGVPPIFVITDRLDTPRQKELFEMLSTFKQNHFGVLQGQEKFEIPNTYNSDNFQSFKALMNDFCNTEMSKRILGGTALTDVKAFEGSSLVQERVAQDRYESDKLMFKHLFNTEIRQRLVKISSLYKDFATHTLIWDNQETLAIKDYIDGVSKLATTFEFDTEEIRKRTGLPIIGTRNISTGLDINPPTGTGGQKKKSEPSLSLKAYTIYAAAWDVAIEQLAQQIYDRKVQPSDLDRDLVLKNYAALNKAASTAWGEGYYEQHITRKMRDNMMRFAGVKAYNLIQSLSNESKSLEREAFIERAKQIVGTHNGLWMEVESQFAANATSTAKDFIRYQGDSDLYPNLKYRTMEDEDVREQHQILDGIIKPVNDPFWSTYTPPNGWRCRCFLEQTIEQPTEKTPHVAIAEQFRNNPATSGQLFTRDNSYEESVNSSDVIKTLDNMERMKQYAPYSRTIDTPGKRKIHVNDFADEKDLKSNITAAKMISDVIGKDIYIRPHSKTQIEPIRNPEFGIGKPGNLADLKSMQSIHVEKFIKNAFISASKQGCKQIILDCSKDEGSNFETRLKRKLKGELKAHIRIEGVIVIHTSGIQQYKRSDVL